MGIFERAVDRLPLLIAGVGMLLGLSLLGEVMLVLRRPGPSYPGFLGGAVTSVPFIVGLIYGGYWLSKSDLSSDRYRYVGRWWGGGMVGTVLLILPITASMRQMPGAILIGTVRWSVAIGGGVGLTVGVFHARAIQRAVEAELARLRQRETQQERDQLEEFASIVSHDLRNPLNIAEGRLALLQEECESPHLDPIAAAHDRMAAIIEDTLTLARMGQAVGDTSPVELSDVATGCWNTVESADATLRTESTATIEADKNRLEHLLENLFRNAIEHGGDDVTVRVGRLDDGTGFYVEDDGPGIPEPDRDRVFEIGYSDANDGTGFGLHIVKTIVEAHDWEIGVTDSEEGGARFEITDRGTAE